MKVIRTQIGATVASLGLLASGLGLTVIAASSAAPSAVAAGASAAVCPKATVVEAGPCVQTK
jgi:hypothetical protein